MYIIHRGTHMATMTEKKRNAVDTVLFTVKAFLDHQANCDQGFRHTCPSCERLIKNMWDARESVMGHEA